MSEPTVWDAIQGTPDEPTPYYTHASYQNPDFPDTPIIVGQVGFVVQGYGGRQIVISMVNGTLCANPIDEPPVAINFDQYMADLVDPDDIVTWDPQSERYVRDQPRPMRTWAKPPTSKN